MLPLNTTIYTFAIFGNATVTINNPFTNGKEFNYVISITMQQEKDLSDTQIFCGDILLAHNYGKDFPQMLTMFDCSNDILSINKTGNDEAYIQIAMLHESPILYATTSTTSPYTGLATINNFTYGEIIIGLFLFFVFMIMFFGGLWNRVIGVKTKVTAYNEYLGNNSEEGKIVYID